MMYRASQVLRVIQQELEKHERALEVDESVSKIDLTVIISQKTKNPVKVIYRPNSETEL